jgi:hypothetical protein
MIVNFASFYISCYTDTELFSWEIRKSIMSLETNTKTTNSYRGHPHTQRPSALFSPLANWCSTHLWRWRQNTNYSPKYNVCTDWTMLSSGMLHSVSCFGTDVSGLLRQLDPLSWDKYGVPKRRWQTNPRCATTKHVRIQVNRSESLRYPFVHITYKNLISHHTIL